MSLTSPPPVHPAPFSPEVLERVEPIVMRLGEPIHDPWAGLGHHLGELCDRHGLPFTATDIEEWPGADDRVRRLDAADPAGYPTGPFCIVTSPVYLNRISTDYVNGPTPNTKPNGRRAYGLCLGHALDEGNLARLARRPNDFYAGHARALAHWSHWALVNVDLPMANAWRQLLERFGYTLVAELRVDTRRYRGPANSDKRPPHEVILAVERNAPWAR